VDVFATHLAHGDPAVNRAQATSLVAYIDQAGERPSIVAGDFNATEDVLHSAAAGWTDTYRAVHPDEQGLTCCIEDLSTRSGEALSLRIDYVFLASGSGRIAVKDSRRVLAQPARLGEGWLQASDHVGVLAILSIGQCKRL
jgi:endonuclease/exonuclease/phosphatase family metal-dependent hydrolase